MDCGGRLRRWSVGSAGGPAERTDGQWDGRIEIKAGRQRRTDRRIEIKAGGQAGRDGRTGKGLPSARALL